MAAYRRMVKGGIALAVLLTAGATLFGGVGAASAQASPTVQTRNLGGNTGTVLTDGAGKTLYTFSLDTNGTSSCTGPCATAWPPLQLASGNPVAPAGLSGTLGVISRSDGTRQVTYNNQPLYYFSGDSAAGQANGNGRSAFNGTWRVAQPAAVPGPSGATQNSATSNQTARAMPATGTGGMSGSEGHEQELTLLAMAALALSVAGIGLLVLPRGHSRA